MTRLRHTSGAKVQVPAEKVPRLVRRGFTLVEPPAAKKAAPRKTTAVKKSETD